MLFEGDARNDAQHTQEIFSDIIDHSLRQVGEYLHKHGRNAQSVDKVHEVAIGFAGEIARLQAADRVITDAPEEDRSGIALKLLEPNFGQTDAENRYTNCLPQKYKQFRRNMQNAGADDDEADEELEIVSESVQEKDFFSQMPLREEDGKWPLALPCKHVYNFSTVIGKKKDGKWSLDKCSVCGKPVGNRADLKEDPGVKNNIIRARHLAGTEESTQMSVEIDDL